jgi:class 3 adenylate cyclase
MRNSLETNLASSFCIMGPPSETEASALLANTLLTGRFITPGYTRYILFWSLLAAFLAMLGIFTLGPYKALAAGSFLAFVSGMGFSWSFIICGYWIDPLIPAAAVFAGTLVFFFISLVFIRRGARNFRLAYGPYIGKTGLKQLIRRGRPLPSELLVSRAAVVAVRNGDLPALEDKDDALAAARAAGIFREGAAEFFKKAGAVIIGAEGDLVLAAFGSPLERIALEASKTGSPRRDGPLDREGRTPAARAAGLITELVRTRKETASWRFGLDTGECAFSWSGLPGYTASGRPVVRARILSGLASRYKARALITEPVRAGLRDIPSRKLNVLASRGDKEYFYELLIKSAGEFNR